MKLGKCKICKQPFEKRSLKHTLCSGKCAIEHLHRQNAKKIAAERTQTRIETIKKKNALKSINDLIKEAQTAFNAFIRERDKFKLCICCDKPYGTNELGGRFDAGHYRSRGAAGHLRFNEDNCFGQRKYCNTYHAGDFREGVIKRIGQERHDSVINNNQIHKWTREELIEIKQKYKLKLKQLKESEMV